MIKKLLFTSAIFCALYVHAQNGILDPTFGSGGKVVTSINPGEDKAYAVKIQSDGKIVVAGMTNNATTGKDFVCVRYFSNGTLDPSFGTNGIKSYDLQTGSDDVAYSMDIQPDGKIILAGFSDNGSSKSAALIRIDSEGNLDSSFGNAGKVIVNLVSGRSDEIKVVKVHALSGNIIVGGTTALTSTNAQGIIARFTSAGVLDTTFNTSGKLSLPNGSGSGTYYHIIEDLDLRPNGKITAVGWINQQGLQWSHNHYACRVNSNGTLDTSFSSDGVATVNGGFNAEDRTYSLILNTDESFLFGGGGHLSTLQYDFIVSLFNASGSTVAGKALFDFGALMRDIAFGMGRDSNGKIVMVGSSFSNTASSFALGRTNADYTIDNSFGTSGKVTTTFGNAHNEAFAMAIQPDNKIIAVGYTGNDFAIARYTDAALSNDSFELTHQVKAYPNPFSQSFVVETNQLGIDDMNYALYDTTGKLVLTGILSGARHEIETSTLTSGLYFLKVNQATIKLVKK